MNKPVDVSIIIVHWNTVQLLRACLASCKKQIGCTFEIVVIDNHSTDSTLQGLIQEFPSITWICNRDNRGFAAANNQGLKIAKGNHLLLLNPDTELPSTDFLKHFVEEGKKRQAGIIGPRLNYSNGSLQPSVRNLPTTAALCTLLSKMHVVFPNLASVKRLMRSDFNYKQAQEVEQVSGACFLISRECFKAVGLFDENFWIWFEEVDYCARARCAKFKIWYTPAVQCMHVGGISFSQVLPVKRQWQFTKSAIRYIRKHKGLFPTLMCLCVAPIGLCLALFTPRSKRQLSYKQ